MLGIASRHGDLEPVVREEHRLAVKQPRGLHRRHVRHVGGREDVGRRALRQLRGEGLRAGIAEGGGDVVCGQELRADLVERGLQ